jgi:DNA-binding response OmpR family regulator
MNTVPHAPPLILFIHDHTSIENLLEYLKSAGLRVARTQNDANMVETVVRLVPDLIVLDFDVDGETATQLKSDARTMSIPLIALAEMAAINRDAGSPPSG